MKTIVFTGDSHTCGQGATGFTMLEGLAEEEKNNLLFHDCWHVNNLGHRIYAEQIIEALGTHL